MRLRAGLWKTLPHAFGTVRAVVLLHGLNASGDAWQDVVPLLRSYHEVYAPTAIGHRGGPPVQRRPATIRDVVDWAERYLDEQDLQHPHLVGHSMGGFVAIELARRGRAATVCALSPGGFWSSGDGLRKRTVAKVTESPWFRWRLGLLDFDQGLVGPFRSVEDGFELCWAVGR